jgi:serine protease Do
MKRIALSFSILLLMVAGSIPAISQEEKDKEKKKDAEQIIITRKGDNKEKMTIEVSGDKITINGKPADEYKDGEIKVHRNKLKTTEGLNVYTVPGQYNGNYNYNWNDGDVLRYYSGADENRAMLGVVTEKTEEGVKVTDVTDESAAEKAGIKEDDIITKIDDTKIEDPDDLSTAVHKHKPGDKVSVTLLRSKKEQKVTAELGKWKGVNSLAIAGVPEMKMMEQTMPRAFSMPRAPYTFSWSGDSPRLGLSVQDTDEGKGVKVIDVDDEGNAYKAGIKEDDIITHVNDKEVNSADEVAKIVKESKDKQSIQVKLKRAGKVQTITVKMPRKLKTADL